MKVYTTQIINDIENKIAQGYAANDKIYYRNIVGTRNSEILFSYTHEEIIELAKCYKDPIYFMEKYCKINTSSGLRNVTLREYQKDIINKSFINKFCVNACSRQTGMTTVKALLALYNSLFRTEYITLFIDNKRCNGIEKLNKIKDIYINLPYFLKPGITHWESTSLRFNNGSVIKIESGSAKTLAIGFSPDYIFIDDYAHMAPNAFQSIFPCIAARKNDKIMISSSPNGFNHFYDLLTNAERKEGDPKKNGFVATRVYWWEVSGRDDEWKKKEILNIGSEDLFNQEYDLQFLTYKR